MKHPRAALLVVLVAYLLALRLSPAFAQWMLNTVSLPALAALHRLTARVPFPVIEPAALAAIVLLLAGLLRSFSRGLRSRTTALPAIALAVSSSPVPVDPAPGAGRLASLCRSLSHWLHRTLALILALIAALALLWAPARAVPVPAVPVPEADRLVWLCGELIDALEASPLAFPDAAETLKLAPAVAGLPGRAVKAARYPEWMALANAWGMFIPLTGEALVDPAEPAPLLPFTAVHELAHLSGIADEGAANVAAWERCMAAGGAFADSARLWALRYALGRLREQDPAAWRTAREKMEGALLRTFLDCGAEVTATHPRRISLAQGDYAALAAHLAGEGG